jgi:hypothetical protein
MVRLGDNSTEPLLAMAEKESSTTFILWLPAHGLYEENRVESHAMWSVALESTIHALLGPTLRRVKLPFGLI